MPEKIIKQTLSEQIYNILKEDILSGRILMGDKLTNRELQERFQVSSTPVRDAINRLSKDGLTQEVSKSGAQLITFDYSYANELNDFITFLACRAVMLSSTEPDTEKLVEKLKMYEEELAAMESVTDGQREAILLSAMAGETDAKKRLIEIYLPQVIEISKLYTGQGVYIEDLVGEGNLALAQGVTMLGCLEHAKEAEGMLMKMVMDAMEELIQEDLTEKDIVKKAIDQEKKKKNNNDSLQTDTDTGEDSAK